MAGEGLKANGIGFEIVETGADPEGTPPAEGDQLNGAPATAGAGDAAAGATPPAGSDADGSAPPNDGVTAPNDGGEPPAATPADQVAAQPKNRHSNRAWKRMDYENRQLKQRLELLEKRLSVGTQTAPPQPKAIDPKSYATQADYIDALVAQRMEQVQERQAQMLSANAQQAQVVQAHVADWNQRVESLIDDADRYSEAISSLGDLNETLGPEIVQYTWQHPYAPLMLQYFGERPEIINTLRRMHPIDMGSALQRIGQFVAAEYAKASQGASAQQSKAVPPVPVGRLGTGGQQVVDVDSLDADAGLAVWRKSGKRI